MWKSCAFAALCGLAIAACATSSPSPAKEAQLEASSRNTVAEMQMKQPGLDRVLQSAYAYAVFPSIGKGGFIAGGAYGKGTLFQHGVPVGYVELKQGSLGFQIGAETFAEIVTLPDQASIDRMRAGKFQLGGDTGVVVLTTGKQGAAEITSDNMVFIMPHGGVMAGISVTGQTIDYLPKGA